ncbi:NAD(P)-binding protein [Hymenopellis radicata]|nr:NAD(P)-binding protein [Hymenopellis radicata]
MSQRTALIVHAVTTDNGAATALRLAADGFNIAICDNASRQDKLDDLARSVAAKGVQWRSYASDVTQEADIIKLLADVVNDFGGLDVLVIATSFATCLGPLVDVLVAEWDGMFTAITRSCFLLYKYAAQHMIRQGRGGRIVSANQICGQQVLRPHLGAYSAAMFAVRGLTQTAALELGPHNITVNSFALGTPGPSEKYEDAKPFWEQIKRFESEGADSQQFVVTRTPLQKKFATGDDIARVVSLLVSKECDFMTGQTIAVNGGIIMS